MIVVCVGLQDDILFVEEVSESEEEEVEEEEAEETNTLSFRHHSQDRDEVDGPEVSEMALSDS